MAQYLSSKIIKAAADRLIESRARDGMVHFLLLKRALIRANANDVAFSSNDEHFTGGMRDLSGTYPEGIGFVSPAGVSPFVKVFGTAGADKYVSGRWTTNGPADALSGPRWSPVIQIIGNRPRRGSFKPDYQTHLQSLLLKAGRNLPGLLDAATWYHRATDLEARFGVVTDAGSLKRYLRDSFIEDLGLTEGETSALFDPETEAFMGQSIGAFLQDGPANPQDYLPDLELTASSGELTEMLASFETAANGATCGLRVGHVLLLRLTSAQCAKRFLILTGLAGSGKTKLAQAFAQWITPPIEEGDEVSRFYAMVPVGSDWTGSEHMLGYPNGLDMESYVTKPALDVILHAHSRPDVPHFLILDEMNLSHVERYLADVLSAIESEARIPLHREAERRTKEQLIPTDLELPKNFFIIGTVNVDETTYMFSPKVLDRAHVIEFRMDADELESFLNNPAKPDLSVLDGKGASFGRAFVDAAKSPVNVPADVKPAYEGEMLLFFKALQGHGAEFGYRTAHEAARFIHFYKLLGDHPDGDATWFPKAFDCVVFQKLLPKLHGSRSKLGPLLKMLWFLCVNDVAGRGTDALKSAEAAARSTEKKAEPLAEVPAGSPNPLSAEKIGRMWRLLRDNGFASFAEA